MVQGDLPHRAHGVRHLDVVADVEGVGCQDHQTAGHVAQNVLRRQSHAQRQHRHQRRQGRGVQSQGLRRDDARQQIKYHLGRCQDDLAQAGSQLFAAVQQPFGQL